MTTKNFVVKNGLTTGNIILDASSSNITANFVVANLSVPATANLGSVSNVIITGGSANYLLQTNGSGVLSWVAPSSSYSNTNVQAYLPTYTGILGGTLSTSAQPNVTQVGTLANLSVTGNISSGGNVIGTYYGNGYNLFGIYGSNVIGQVGNSLIAGTVYTAAQPNITSTGTLNGLAVTGTANLTLASNVSLGPVGNIHISGGSANYVLSTDGAGTLSWVAQSGGTSSNANYTFDRFTGNGVQTQFTLSTTPDANTVLINYNGALQLSNAYSIAGNIITMSEAPYNGSIIEAITLSGTASGGSGSGTSLNKSIGINMFLGGF